MSRHGNRHLLLATALKASSAVMVGYLSLGAAFGLLFAETGYPWPLATMMALLVYAGSAQFLAVGLLAARTPLLEVGLATLLLNARHLFYGLAMLGPYHHSGWRKPYLVFGLTDETFAVLGHLQAPSGLDRHDLQLAVTACNQLAWVAGCTLGAVAGGRLERVPESFGFVLTALFVVLLVDQLRRTDRRYPLLIAALAAAVALAVGGPDSLLAAGLGLALTGLLIVGWLTQWQS